jgi:hypothetical protein
MSIKSFTLAFPISLFLLSILCFADKAPGMSSPVPHSVDQVETYRVGEDLIRIIRHNMEMLPQIDIERLSTPEVGLLESISIDSIVLKGEERKFSQSSGVFIEAIEIDGRTIKIELNYYPDDESSFVVLCEVLIKEKSFEAPVCIKKQ